MLCNYSKLTQLKEIWPDSKTTVADINESAVKGKNAIPQEELEPMETIPGFATSSKAQQKTVSVTQYPQEYCSYCGPAAVRSVLSNMGFDSVLPYYGYQESTFYLFVLPRGIVY